MSEPSQSEPRWPEVPRGRIEDRAEQSRIMLAITEALPDDVHYHNLVMALAEMQQRIVGEYVRAIREGDQETPEG